MVNVKDWIDLFCGKRDELFYQERNVRWIQFQTWMCCSDDNDIVEKAGVLSAVNILSRISPRVEMRGGVAVRQARQIAATLRNSPYASLYDAILAPQGGWTRLQFTEGAEFDDALARARKDTGIVTAMVDYQFRYFDHGGSDEQLANLNHARFYIYKFRTPIIRGKLSKQAWRHHKRSSLFLYVNEKHDFGLWPSREALDYNDFVWRTALSFLATCAYVADQLNRLGGEFSEQHAMLASIADRIRPKTEALPQTEDELRAAYDYKAMLAS
jgi:hypothetical protein